MPWSRTSPMDQKTQFIADYLRQRQSITELCTNFGISRKTGYKWIDRYPRSGGRLQRCEAEGSVGLVIQNELHGMVAEVTHMSLNQCNLTTELSGWPR